TSQRHRSSDSWLTFKNSDGSASYLAKRPTARRPNTRQNTESPVYVATFHGPGPGQLSDQRLAIGGYYTRVVKLEAADVAYRSPTSCSRDRRHCVHQNRQLRRSLSDNHTLLGRLTLQIAARRAPK